MTRLCAILIALVSISGCAPKPEPPPSRDYQFEALQNQVRQMEIFIDNWSGYEQKFSRISRSYRQYLVSFSDEMQNRYQFAQAVDVTNKDSENGIRPGEHVVWSYRFSRDNHPLETVNSFKIIYPKKVFGKPFRLTIPLKTISKPTVPVSLRNGLS